MHYRNVVCLLSCSLFLSSAWGCRLDEPEHNIYQKQGKGVVYLRPYEKTNLSLPQINYKRLRLLPNLLIDPTKLKDWETVPPATDLTTDVVYSGANATLPHYSYYSDGRAIRKRLARTVLIFTERSDQLSRATDRVPGLPASPGYAQ